MSKYFLITFFSFLFILSCQKEEKKEKTQNQIKKPEMSVVVTHTPPTVLTPNSQKKVTDWKEYKEINNFLDRFNKTSPSEALSNASELKDLSKSLKDTIRVEILKTPAFKARLNVFENEALRLADMTYISAITPKEVNQQIDKILLLFESINAKIDATFLKEKLNKDIYSDSSLSKKPSKEKKKITLKKDKTTSNLKIKRN